MSDVCTLQNFINPIYFALKNDDKNRKSLIFVSPGNIEMKMNTDAGSN